MEKLLKSFQKGRKGGDGTMHCRQADQFLVRIIIMSYLHFDVIDNFILVHFVQFNLNETEIYYTFCVNVFYNTE